MENYNDKQPAENCRGQKEVSVFPDWMLRMLGRMDARYGEEYCLGRISQYHERLKVITEAELIYTEDSLYPVRKQASGALAELAILSEKMGEAGKVLVGDDPDSVRANRSNMEKMKSLEEEITNILLEIVEINQELIHYHTVLDQRILKAEQCARAKVCAYASGVVRRITDFQQPEIFPHNRAVERYLERHRNLDSQIKKVAGQFLAEREGEGINA